MSKINESIVARIQERLTALNLRPRTASMMATGKPDAIRTILNGVMPSAERLDQIAEVLQTTSGYLLGSVDDVGVPDEEPPITTAYNAKDGARYEPKPEHEQEPAALPARKDMPKDIPVYGSAIGTSEDIEALEDGKVAVEQTTLNTGEVIDYFRRPPGLNNSRRAYGLYVDGFSMEPVFEPGSVIIVDPSRPPSMRDFVVVYMRGDEAGGDTMVASVMLKRLVRRSATFVELEQYNPPARFRINTDSITQMHRVLPLAEIVGV